MKIICLFVIFAFISCRTEADDVYDIYYNYEYSLSSKMSLFYSYVFRLQVNEGDTMDFEFKVLSDNHAFSFDVFWFDHKPDETEALRTDGKRVDLKGRPALYQEDGYWVYPYTFKAPEHSTYFSIRVDMNNYYDYSYIVFRINLLRYKYSNIKDLDFNVGYTYDVNIFGDKKIPPYYQIYIRIPAFGEDKMEVQLTTKQEPHDKDNDFLVEVCQYKFEPTQKQVYYPDVACSEPLNNTSEETYEYTYPFTTDKDINYLSIRISNSNRQLNYLYMYIFSEKGLAAAIIAVIVIACIIAAGGIGYLIYYLAKRLGCCNN